MKTPLLDRKKVLYVITKATYGGAQKYVYDLATNIPKEEFEMIVAYGTHGKLAEDLSAAGTKVRQLPSLGRDIAIISDIKSFFEILKTVRELKPDVIHLNSSKAAALGAFAARLAGVPKIIFTVHGWPFKENRNVFSRWLIYAVSWLTGLLSHIVIVVSRSDATLGKRMRGVSGKIRHIEIGVEPQVFLPREKAAAALSITDPHPRVVTIAELTENKGVRYAVEAIAELKKRNILVSYFVIGDGEKRVELEEQAKRQGVADRVRFLGFLPNAAEYLRAFDIFLLPSIKEGTPYVLLEAGNAMLPIVMTNAADIELAEHLPNVRVIPTRDAPALAGAIIETIEDVAETELFPEKAVFPLSEMLEKTVFLYR